MKHKVFVVDDHLVVREGLKLILETNDQFEIIGEAENGQEALEVLNTVKPDVILMDLNMPVMNGLDTIEALGKRKSDIPIIILTVYNEDELVIQGLKFGAKGYLLKDAKRDELFQTIDAAIKGKTLVQPELMEKLNRAKVKEDHSFQNPQTTQLTNRERMILQAVAKGHLNREIASDMHISERTVKAHLTNIFNKLNVSTRTEAVAVALEGKIISF
ncbi:response regulator transcription factor [Sporolactobacillus shoreicorticis]|uniref:Response regulator n=1 Tax=Sporolactobacillus shoreicorticis TaxID=1923877 RepID=A0ABW5S010_9BACL|nr:response regulator transcription factor [Sporolactobacillus shoreicorticis]MCO7128150.1 response regulator transcription factor [Sporolactobacillus shoreicorticis]